MPVPVTTKHGPVSQVSDRLLLRAHLPPLNLPHLTTQPPLPLPLLTTFLVLEQVQLLPLLFLTDDRSSGGKSQETETVLMLSDYYARGGEDLVHSSE